MGRSVKLAAGIVLAASVMSACGSGSGSGSSNASASSGTASSKDPIVLGASVSTTGKYASSGTNVANGYKLAVEQINAKGGVLGRQLKLDLQDDQSDAGTVGRAYTTFLATDKVDALLSPYGSALAGPAAQLAERFKTPMAHSQTSSPDVFKGTKYNVMAGLGPGSTVLAQVPAFAVQNKYPKITLVNSDLDAYSQICDGVQQAIPKAGATQVDRITYAATTSDFSSTALKVKQGNPDVVVECSAIQDTIGLTRALDQQGFRPKIIASPTAEDPAFLTSLGALANHAVTYSIFAPSLNKPGASTFSSGYQKDFGKEANGQSAAAYATVQVLAAAMEKAKSTDHDKVNAALHSGSFQTILGTYKVNSEGVQTGYSPVLDEYIDGKLEVVYPQSAHSVPAQLPY